MQSIEKTNVGNKTVLLRVDFNVPVKEGKVGDDFRIKSTLPTINYLKKNNAKIIILSHLGRPNGKEDKNLSLKPAAQRLEKLLGSKVVFFKNLAEAQKNVKNMKSGDVAMLENLRFNLGEEKGSKIFAEKLATLGEIYVNDAFAASHRKHASVYLLPYILPSYAGLLLLKEVEMLDKIRIAAKRPQVFLTGGAKVETKLKTLSEIITKIDHVCVGGLIANTLLVSKSVNIGKSRYEKGMEKYTQKLHLTDKKIHLPVDVMVSTDPSGHNSTHIRAVGKIEKDEIILDIGPETIKLFKNIIKEASMIVWNGPMGLFEVEAFSNGTYDLARTLKEVEAEVVVGGGDIMQAMKDVDAENSIDHASTGGGAMLQYLAEGTLPAIKVLK